MVRILQSDNIQFVLTVRFSLDPVKIFFDQQKKRRQRNDNSSVAQFLYITYTLVIQKSLVLVVSVTYVTEPAKIRPS